MLQVCFPREMHFRQIIEKTQHRTNTFIFNFSKTQLSIYSIKEHRNAVLITILANCCRQYILPESPIKFMVNSFHLTRGMKELKENHGACIVLKHIIGSSTIEFDFINNITGEKVIPSTSVSIIKECPKYKLKPFPLLSKASTICMNSSELRRILNTQTITSCINVDITMTPDNVTIESGSSRLGKIINECNNDFNEKEYKGYQEDNIFAQCPKNCMDRNIIRMNPDHGDMIKIRHNLASIAFCEKPRTDANRVTLGITPGMPVIIEYKLFNTGFVSYYNGDNLFE